MQALTLDQTGTGAKEKLTWKRIPAIMRLYMGGIWTPPGVFLSSLESLAKWLSQTEAMSESSRAGNEALAK
jgi:hypothetical protein